MATIYGVHNPADATFVPSTTQYSDGDVVGGLLTFTFEAKSGAVITILLTENDNEGAVLDLFLFNEAPSTIADNTAFTPTIADMQKLIRKVAIASSDYGTENNIKTAQVDPFNPIPFATDTLYGYLVCNGSNPTFASEKTVQVRLIPVGES